MKTMTPGKIGGANRRPASRFDRAARRTLALSAAGFQLLAGLMHLQAASVTLTADDPVNTTSFNTAGGWSNGQPPAGTNDYFTSFQMRTPSLNGTPATFAGASLTIEASGSLVFTMSNVVTVANLRLDGGGLIQGDMGGSPDVARLAGAVTLLADSYVDTGTNAGRQVQMFAPITGTAGLTFRGNNATVVLDADNSYAGATVLALTNSSTLQVGNNDGVGALGAGPVMLSSGVNLVFARTNDLRVTSPISGGGPLIMRGAGTLTLGATDTYTGVTTVNAGTLSVEGILAASLVWVSGGTLAGTGVIGGPVYIKATGILAPGPSVGTLTISNTLSLQGLTVMEIDQAAGACDLVRGLTSVTYGGTLIVSNRAGSFAAGTAFRLFDAASYRGSFASIIPDEPGTGLLWDTSTLKTDGTLRVKSAMSTAPTNLSTASLGPDRLGISWPGDHTGWRLEAQTNRLGVGVSTNWFPVPGSMTTNRLYLPIDPNNPAVFFRLSTAPPTNPVNPLYVAWGQAVAGEIERTLRLAGSPLYAETALLSGGQTGGSGGKAFVWPVSTQFRVLTLRAALDPATYTARLREFSDAVHTGYWEPSGGGYRSGVSPGAERYYDDNGHMAVALTEAYAVTGDPVYLDRARETFAFVLSGEDSVGGGGIYFSESDRSAKDAGSTLQGARAAMMLYRATGESAYVNAGRRLYSWAKNAIQQSAGGVFYQRYWVTGPNAFHADGQPLVNSSGFALSANVLFYEASGDVGDLLEAQRLATSALAAYTGADGRFNDEGYWVFELVEGLLNLYELDRRSTWRDAVVNGLTWLYNNKQDIYGHYGTLWGRNGPQTSPLAQWSLNDMACVARAYLRLAAAPPGPAP